VRDFAINGFPGPSRNRPQGTTTLDNNVFCASYLNKTIATASFITLSPNTRAYRSTSTCRSWKIASTVTVNRNKMIPSHLSVLV